jgi:hypothetical protein
MNRQNRIAELDYHLLVHASGWNIWRAKSADTPLHPTAWLSLAWRVDEQVVPSSSAEDESWLTILVFGRRHLDDGRLLSLETYHCSSWQRLLASSWLRSQPERQQAAR